jgi:hypothetical protein
MRKLFAALAVTAVAAIYGCASDLNDAAGEVSNRVDCGKVCNKYDSCERKIDVSACTSACEERVDNDTNYSNSADTCESCVEDKACESAKPCWSSCPVVPLQD